MERLLRSLKVGAQLLPITLRRCFAPGVFISQFFQNFLFQNFLVFVGLYHREIVIIIHNHNE